MSAKGRGRHEGGGEDYYPTPAWAVHRLLDDCGDFLLTRDGAPALEPTCGDGAIVRAVHSWPGHKVSIAWTGVELRTGALAENTQLAHHIEGVDFMSWNPSTVFDLALGNPPFAIAEKIIRRALDHSHVVAMLLRVSFLGSDERVEFFRGVGADPALRVLPDRPSFDGIGTDASTYAWFVWGHPEIRGVRMLESTPVAERKAQTPQGIEQSLRQVRLAW